MSISEQDEGTFPGAEDVASSEMSGLGNTRRHARPGDSGVMQCLGCSTSDRKRLLHEKRCFASIRSEIHPIFLRFTGGRLSSRPYQSDAISASRVSSTFSLGHSLKLCWGLGMRSLVLTVTAVLVIGFAAPGCRHLAMKSAVETIKRPSRHSVRSDHLLLLSDFKIDSDHSLVHGLERVREQVITELQLPPQRDSVVVYLFEDEDSYRRYLEATWPGLPPRRAYFVGTPRELAVYTFWGDRILEDLRHEYTHGVLHASLIDVPLWLDEGLAEYFEVPGATIGNVNSEYARELSESIASGWSPDMTRLEAITEFSKMDRVDYQESWSWVHFMLHHSPDTRSVLIEFVSELRDNPNPRFLSERLNELQPAYRERFASYVASMGSLPVAAGG